MNQDKLVKFLSAEQVTQINERLGREITAHYKSVLKADEQLIVIVTLKGALFFAADLTRHLDLPVCIDFVRVASYGAGTSSSGEVKLLKDIEVDPKGKHLLILDEIVDSGRTLEALMKRLKSREPASLKLCSLLSKPSRREIDLPVAYIGLEIEDKFVVGYGLDYGEKYRNLKDIYVVEN